MYFAGHFRNLQTWFSLGYNQGIFHPHFTFALFAQGIWFISASHCKCIFWDHITSSPQGYRVFVVPSLYCLVIYVWALAVPCLQALLPFWLPLSHLRFIFPLKMVTFLSMILFLWPHGYRLTVQLRPWNFSAQCKPLALCQPMVYYAFFGFDEAFTCFIFPHRICTMVFDGAFPPPPPPLRIMLASAGFPFLSFLCWGFSLPRTLLIP